MRCVLGVANDLARILLKETDMKNDGDGEKVRIGGLIEEELLEDIDQAAREAGVEWDTSGFKNELLREALERRGLLGAN